MVYVPWYKTVRKTETTQKHAHIRVRVKVRVRETTQKHAHIRGRVRVRAKVSAHAQTHTLQFGTCPNTYTGQLCRSVVHMPKQLRQCTSTIKS